MSLEFVNELVDRNLIECYVSMRCGDTDMFVVQEKESLRVNIVDVNSLDNYVGSTLLVQGSLVDCNQFKCYYGKLILTFVEYETDGYVELPIDKLAESYLFTNGTLTTKSGEFTGLLFEGVCSSDIDELSNILERNRVCRDKRPTFSYNFKECSSNFVIKNLSQWYDAIEFNYKFSESIEAFLGNNYVALSDEDRVTCLFLAKSLDKFAKYDFTEFFTNRPVTKSAEVSKTFSFLK